MRPSNLITFEQAAAQLCISESALDDLIDSGVANQAQASSAPIKIAQSHHSGKQVIIFGDIPAFGTVLALLLLPG